MVGYGVHPHYQPLRTPLQPPPPCPNRQRGHLLQGCFHSLFWRSSFISRPDISSTGSVCCRMSVLGNLAEEETGGTKRSCFLEERGKGWSSKRPIATRRASRAISGFILKVRKYVRRQSSLHWITAWNFSHHSCLCNMFAGTCTSVGEASTIILR